jgi:hypothetical protein
MTALRVPSAGQSAGTAITGAQKVLSESVAWQTDPVHLECIVWSQIAFIAGPCLTERQGPQLCI